MGCGCGRRSLMGFSVFFFSFLFFSLLSSLWDCVNVDISSRSPRPSHSPRPRPPSRLATACTRSPSHSPRQRSSRTQYVPLTAEQTKAKLEELRHKLAEKRARQAVEDVEANRANEVRFPGFASFSGLGSRSGVVSILFRCSGLIGHPWSTAAAYTWDSIQV